MFAIKGGFNMKKYGLHKKILSIIAFVFLLSACAGALPENKDATVKASDLSEQYTLGPEDVIEVSVWEEPELSKVVSIRPDGRISLPLIGDVQASGLTAEELTKNIQNALMEYLDSPTVAIIVLNINSLKIFVQGEVAQPGVLQVKSNITILQAISLSGGFTQWARTDKILVLRKKGDTVEKIPVNYKKILTAEDLSQNIILKRGDTIIIP